MNDRKCGYINGQGHTPSPAQCAVWWARSGCVNGTKLRDLVLSKVWTIDHWCWAIHILVWCHYQNPNPIVPTGIPLGKTTPLRNYKGPLPYRRSIDRAMAYGMTIPETASQIHPGAHLSIAVKCSCTLDSGHWDSLFRMSPKQAVRRVSTPSLLDSFPTRSGHPFPSLNRSWVCSSYTYSMPSGPL